MSLPHLHDLDPSLERDQDRTEREKLTGRIIHPFLLADNRHYVFYLFRWVFIPFPIAKYAVTPVYLVCGWLWSWRLRDSATLLGLLSLFVCTAATLIPTPLIEPRYFLIPTIILRIMLASELPLSKRNLAIKEHSAGSTKKRGTGRSGQALTLDENDDDEEMQKDQTPRLGLGVEMAWYTLINVATVSLFLLRKFRWDGWEGWMRFMW